MPRRTQGNVYRTATGYGIRWPEDGHRPHQAGFTTKTEARRWFAENVAPRLDRGARRRKLASIASATSTSNAGGLQSPTRPAGRLRSGSPPLASSSATGPCASSRAVPPTLPVGGLASGSESVTASPAGCDRRLQRRSGGATSRRIPRWRRDRTRNPSSRRSTRSHRRKSTRSRRSSDAAPQPWSCSPPRLGCERTSGPRSSAATSTARGWPSWCGAAMPAVARLPIRRQPVGVWCSLIVHSRRRSRYHPGSTRPCSSPPPRAGRSTSTLASA
jgi:hypothetical protein